MVGCSTKTTNTHEPVGTTCNVVPQTKSLSVNVLKSHSAHQINSLAGKWAFFIYIYIYIYPS